MGGRWALTAILTANQYPCGVLAIIGVLEKMQGQLKKLAVATDSKYAYDGLTGSAFRWSSAGWVGKAGPVANVDLWIRLLHLLDSSALTLQWLKVPSHTKTYVRSTSGRGQEKLARLSCLVNAEKASRFSRAALHPYTTQSCGSAHVS